MSVKLLTEHHLEFLSLKGGCTGSFVNAILLEITCHGSIIRQIYFNNLDDEAEIIMPGKTANDTSS